MTIKISHSYLNKIYIIIVSVQSCFVFCSDFGPHNLLLGEGGSVLVTLETRWQVVLRETPGQGHARGHCDHGTYSHESEAKQSRKQSSNNPYVGHSEHKSRNKLPIDPTSKIANDLVENRDKQKPTDCACANSVLKNCKVCSSTNPITSVLNQPANAQCAVLSTSKPSLRKDIISQSIKIKPTDPECPNRAHGVKGKQAVLTTGKAGRSSHCASRRRDSPLTTPVTCCCGGLCAVCLGYVAPEARSPLYVATPASDWWSVGALLYHLLTGQSVSSQHPSGITGHTELSLPSHLSPEAVLLLTQVGIITLTHCIICCIQILYFGNADSVE